MKNKIDVVTEATDALAANCLEGSYPDHRRHARKFSLVFTIVFFSLLQTKSATIRPYFRDV